MGQELDRDLFFLLHDVARLVGVEADKRARCRGMTRAQWGVLLRLERNPGLTQKEIADLMEVEPISVARLIDKLAAAELVERRADEQDRRVWRLHLTASGEARLGEIAEQRTQLRELVADGVSEATRESMVRALLHMKSNLLKPAAGRVEKKVA